MAVNVSNMSTKKFLYLINIFPNHSSGKGATWKTHT